MDDFVQVKPRDDGNWDIHLNRSWGDNVVFPIENGEIEELARVLFAMGFGQERDYWISVREDHEQGRYQPY